MNTFLCLIACGLISLISASLPQNVHDSQEARNLFHLADENSDYLLTPNEFHSVFLSFDLNNDTHLSSDEFLKDWTTKNLGTAIEAVTLFHHLDVNKDGVIEESIDLPWIIKFFDRSEDGHINESEFVVQWIKIKSADNYYHVTYVDHGYISNTASKSISMSKTTNGNVSPVTQTSITFTPSSSKRSSTVSSSTSMFPSTTFRQPLSSTSMKTYVPSKSSSTTTVRPPSTKSSTSMSSFLTNSSSVQPTTVQSLSSRSTSKNILPTPVISSVTAPSLTSMPSSSYKSSSTINTSTVRSSTELLTTIRQPTSCYVCSGPMFICEQRFHSEQCPNVDQQYCINLMTNNVDGTRTVDRRCATKDECARQWIKNTSHRSECTLYDVNRAYGYHFECSFCCHGSDCNRDLIPKNLYSMV